MGSSITKSKSIDVEKLQSKPFIAMVDSAPYIDRNYEFNFYLHCDINQRLPKEIIFLNIGQNRRNNLKITHLLDAYGEIIICKIQNGKLSMNVKQIQDKLSKKEKNKKTIKRGLFINKSKGINFLDLSLSRNGIHSSYYFNNSYIVTASSQWFYLDQHLQNSPNTFEEYNKESNTLVKCLHPIYNRKNKTLDTFTMQENITIKGITSTFTFYQFGQKDKQNIKEKDIIKKINTVTFDSFFTVHGFYSTPNWYILPQIPQKPNYIKLTLGIESVARGLNSDNQSLKVHFISRNDPKLPIISINFEDVKYIYHIIHAYEIESKIIFYVFLSESNVVQESSQFELNQEYKLFNNTGRFYRVEVDFLDNSVKKTLLVPQVEDCIDFHAINHLFDNQSISYVYEVSRKENYQGSTLRKLNICNDGYVEKEWTHENYILRQPEFIPLIDSKEEDDGIILILAYETPQNGYQSQTHLLVFDAKNIDKGPINTPMIINPSLSYSIHSFSNWTN
jgi:hypothetical protein